MATTDELTRRVGDRAAAAIAEAYEAVVEASCGPDGISLLSPEQRLRIVDALVREAEGGWVDTFHLKEIAFDLLPECANQPARR